MTRRDYPVPAGRAPGSGRRRRRGARGGGPRARQEPPGGLFLPVALFTHAVLGVGVASSIQPDSPLRRILPGTRTAPSDPVPSPAA